MFIMDEKRENVQNDNHIPFKLVIFPGELSWFDDCKSRKLLVRRSLSHASSRTGHIVDFNNGLLLSSRQRCAGTRLESTSAPSRTITPILDPTASDQQCKMSDKEFGSK